MKRNDIATFTRILPAIFAVVFLMSCIEAQCQKIYEWAGIKYMLEDDGTAWVSGVTNKNIKNIVIEEYIIADDGNDCSQYKVTSISSRVFEGCTKAISVSIPPSITKIWSYTFKDCISLSSFTVPSTINCIQQDAFQGCSHLSSLTIEDSDNSLELEWGIFGAFSECGLETIYIGRNISETNAYTATIENTSLKSVTTGELVTKIPYEAFCNCRELSTVTLNDAIKIIGYRAFAGCRKLKEINWPQSLVTINDYAFYECELLDNISIPKGTESIGDRAFSGCLSLTEIKFPNTLSSLGAYAFEDCTFLKTINWGYKLDCIGDGAFKDCTHIEELTLAPQIKQIGDYAFSGCSGLRNLSISKTALQSIGAYAFENCISLTNIVGENITGYYGQLTINKGAFSGCTGLENFAIKNYVIIYKDAFSGCSSLKNITLSDGARFNSPTIFTGCPIEKVSYASDLNGEDSSGNNYLPFKDLTTIKYLEIGGGTDDSLSKIRKDEFEKSAKSLIWLAIKNGNSTTLAISDSFIADSLYLAKTVTYIDEDEYPSDDNPFGIGKFNKITIDEYFRYLNIPENAFVGSSIESIYIPRGATIGANAFKNCANLKNVAFMNRKDSFGNSCFSGCPIEIIEIGDAYYSSFLPDIQSDSFDQWVYDNAYVYYPEKVSDTVVEESNWRLFTHKYKIPSNSTIRSINVELGVGECVNLRELVEETYEQYNIPNLLYSYAYDNTNGYIENDIFKAETEGGFYVTAYIYLPYPVYKCETVYIDITVTGKTGINDILYPDDKLKFPLDVYNLQGMLIKRITSTDNIDLVPGIYIINGKKIYVK